MRWLPLLTFSVAYLTSLTIARNLSTMSLSALPNTSFSESSVTVTVKSPVAIRSAT